VISTLAGLCGPPSDSRIMWSAEGQSAQDAPGTASARRAVSRHIPHSPLHARRSRWWQSIHGAVGRICPRRCDPASASPRGASSRTKPMAVTWQGHLLIPEDRRSRAAEITNIHHPAVLAETPQGPLWQPSVDRVSCVGCPAAWPQSIKAAPRLTLTRTRRARRGCPGPPRSRRSTQAGPQGASADGDHRDADQAADSPASRC
jgi:hypothetical protein